MSIHARKLVRAGAQVSLGVAVAALSVALGAGPAAALTPGHTGTSTTGDTPTPPQNPAPRTDPKTPPKRPQKPPAEPKKGTVCIAAWNDANRNGLRDKGEKPLAGIPVQIYRTDVAAPKPDLKGIRQGAVAATDNNESPFDLTAGKGGEVCGSTDAGTYRAVVLMGPYEEDAAHNITVDKVWTLTKAKVGKNETKDSDFIPLVVAGKPDVANLVGIVESFTVKPGKKVTLDAGLFKAGAAVPPPANGNGGGSLPVTGAAAGGILAAGVLLVGGGAALTVATRRRRRTTA